MRRKAKPRTGRPPTERRSLGGRKVTIRVSAAEFAAIDSAAAASDVTVSAYVRDIVILASAGRLTTLGSKPKATE